MTRILNRKKNILCSDNLIISNFKSIFVQIIPKFFQPNKNPLGSIIFNLVLYARASFFNKRPCFTKCMFLKNKCSIIKKKNHFSVKVLKNLLIFIHQFINIFKKKSGHKTKTIMKSE